MWRSKRLKNVPLGTKVVTRPPKPFSLMMTGDVFGVFFVFLAFGSSLCRGFVPLKNM